MKLIDLTHTFTDDMPVYPGDPKSVLEQVAFIDKDTYNDHRITTVMHVGTHMDAPLHMIENGKTIDELPLDAFIGQGILIDVRGKKEIDASCLDNLDIENGSILLFYTGYGTKYRTGDYFKDSPFFSPELAKKLVDLKVKMIGMDISGPDSDSSWPAHKILLGADILILENLTNLDKLLEIKEFEVIALPISLRSDASPVRVIARINKN